jgi:hypothetical protein
VATQKDGGKVNEKCPRCGAEYRETTKNDSDRLVKFFSCGTIMHPPCEWLPKGGILHEVAKCLHNQIFVLTAKLDAVTQDRDEYKDRLDEAINALEEVEGLRRDQTEKGKGIE